MFNVKILNTTNTREWLEVLGRCNLKDPCYLPQYLQIYENLENKEIFSNFGGQGVLFVYGDEKNMIIYPFFKRAISDLPFATGKFAKLFDIISPYGYGGPLAQIEDEALTEELWRGFYSQFDMYCHTQLIISEFCRLQPIYENHKSVIAYSGGITTKIGQVVYLDLTVSEEEILANMEHSHRRKIRKALNNHDLVFNVIKYVDSSQSFYNLYTENMQRVGVENKYLFPPSFFENAFQLLNEHISLNQISNLGIPCAQWVVLENGDYAYSWLSATNMDFYNLSPNNLMVYELCLALKTRGIKYFNLGGGRGAQKDSVYQFKAGFSKLYRDFYIYKKIYLQEEYNELVELLNSDHENTEEFFPKYRVSAAD